MFLRARKAVPQKVCFRGCRQEGTCQVVACAPCCVWQRTLVSRRRFHTLAADRAVGETQLLTLGDGFPLRAWLS